MQESEGSSTSVKNCHNALQRCVHSVLSSTLPRTPHKNAMSPLMPSTPLYEAQLPTPCHVSSLDSASTFYPLASPLGGSNQTLPSRPSTRYACSTCGQLTSPYTQPVTHNSPASHGANDFGIGTAWTSHSLKMSFSPPPAHQSTTSLPCQLHSQPSVLSSCVATTLGFKKDISSEVSAMSLPSMGIGSRGASTAWSSDHVFTSTLFPGQFSTQLSVTHSTSRDHDPHSMSTVLSGVRDNITLEEGHAGPVK